MSSKSLLALDVGEKRIGVALADRSVKIAIPYLTITVDGTEFDQIGELVLQEGVEAIVVGYPRNQSGESTAQTNYVEQFVAKLKEREDLPEVIFQDESLTSVHAEEQLRQQNRHYKKSEVDMVAASIILQDYLESHGRI